MEGGLGGIGNEHEARKRLQGDSSLEVEGNSRNRFSLAARSWHEQIDERERAISWGRGISPSERNSILPEGNGHGPGATGRISHDEKETHPNKDGGGKRSKSVITQKKNRKAKIGQLREPSYVIKFRRPS